MGLPPLSRCCRRCRKPAWLVLREASQARCSSRWLYRRNVLCFGDSLTEGFCGAGLSFAPYSDQLSLRLRELSATEGAAAPQVVNAGVSGERSRQMLQRLPAFVRSSEEGAPVHGPLDVVLVLGGTNDLPSLPAEDIVENLLAMHRLVHQSGAVSGVLTIPVVTLGIDRSVQPFKEKQEFVNEKLREFAQEHKDRSFLVDVAAAFPQDSAHRRLWEPDGVHMTAEGYRAMGDLIARAEPPVPLSS